jgi:hypothetical protein
VTRSGRDGADRLLDGAVRLLPAGRREWGRAMRAELARLVPDGDRRRFALGCVRVVATQPSTLRGARHLMLMAGVVVTILVWSGTIGYAPLRWGLVAGTLVLVAVSWLGRRPGMLGPVGDDAAARLVRTAGYLLVGGMGLGFLASVSGHGNPDQQARFGVPLFTVVLTTCLLGFLAVTAHRCAATPRVLTAAAVAGAAAAALWSVAVVTVPPIPPSTAGALVLTVAAAIGAASANAGRRGRNEHRLLAATCAACLAPLLIFMLVLVLSSYGPPGLIPDLAPAALTPADDLAQSRSEVVDHYLALLFMGGLLAGILGVASIAAGRRPAAQLDRAPATVR